MSTRRSVNRRPQAEAAESELAALPAGDAVVYDRATAPRACRDDIATPVAASSGLRHCHADGSGHTPPAITLLDRERYALAELALLDPDLDDATAIRKRH